MFCKKTFETYSSFQFEDIALTYNPFEILVEQNKNYLRSKPKDQKYI